MSVRYSVILGEVTLDQFDEIVDWLEERQIHYHLHVIPAPLFGNIYLRIDLYSAQDTILFKLSWV